MYGFKRILTRALFSLLIAAFFVVMSNPASGDTTIYGYTFSDDSTDLHMNTYFSEYDRMVDFLTGLYGYGDFTGYDLFQVFNQTFTLDGIDCVVIREHIDIPLYGGFSPDVDVHDIYYYTKDIEDNIHILQFTYYSGEESIGWHYNELPEGRTTMKYPCPYP
jgi:hypothetical protein